MIDTGSGPRSVGMDSSSLPSPFNRRRRAASFGAFFLLASAWLLAGPGVPEKPLRPLFPKNGLPEGWVVRAWDNVANAAQGNPTWRVEDGVLIAGEPRGSWLLSEKEYGDFILEFDFLLGERGNSGCALRAPLSGDPAFDGFELQMADLRYNPQAKDSELTGGLYRAVAPKQQVYKPAEWNHYRIVCKGSNITVDLNGTRILEVDLDKETATVKRHDGTEAPPLKDRPRKGHIGFQELSREGGRTRIRNARIVELAGG